MNNAQILHEQFQLVTDSPGGIKKLRQLILTPAMQGKLIPQDPNDPPVSELLKKIAAEKKMPGQRGKNQSAKNHYRRTTPHRCLNRPAAGAVR